MVHSILSYSHKSIDLIVIGVRNAKASNLMQVIILYLYQLQLFKMVILTSFKGSAELKSY